MFLKLLQYFIYFHNRAKHYKENYLPGPWTSCSVPLKYVLPQISIWITRWPRIAFQFHLPAVACEESGLQRLSFSGVTCLFRGNGPSRASVRPALRAGTAPGTGGLGLQPPRVRVRGPWPSPVGQTPKSVGPMWDLHWASWRRCFVFTPGS